MALPRVPVATRSDLDSRPLIRFDARAQLLERALRRTSRVSSVTAGMLDVSIRVDGLDSPDVAGMRREVSKLIRNAAKSLKDAVVQKNRQIGYDTGLMASSWRESVDVERPDTFTIELTNPTPYAAVAKKAGSDWHAGRTMLEYHIRPLVKRRARLLAKELTTTLAAMFKRRRARGAR